MNTTITPPKAQIPIGTITINGVRYDVAQHPEFVRFFFDLLRRVGGSSATSNTDLASMVEQLQGQEMTMQPTPAQGQALPDIMQTSGFDAIASETTWQRI